ncbi:hypothetical protein [Nonomuraea sp. bgisy101]|uniref:hypothetical protein n=1 Tax=Nonomuraea sp. bgisy101 TaxID=3413784 RepID=UPI003D7592F1
MAKSNPKISSARESRFRIVFGVHGQPMGGGRDIAVGVQVGEDGGRIHTSAAFAERLPQGRHRRLHRYNIRRRHSRLGQRGPITYENSLIATSTTLTDAA